MDTEIARRAMVRAQIEARGIRNPEVLRAMGVVPRHRFVPPEREADAYGDHPVPLAFGQSVSQPYMVATLMEEARVQSGSRVLDVGTGSGYQAAVAAELGAEVTSVERIPRLAAHAERVLTSLGYALSVHVSDGRRGWPDHAPYDAILVAAAAPRIPEPLIDQLAIEGRLLMPVGDEHHQELVMLHRMPWGEVRRTTLMRVLFVPLLDGLHPES